MLTITFTCITAFVITFMAIPSIIRVSIVKNLFDEPSERKSHSSSIPTLGGLAIFAGVVFSYTFWSAGYDYTASQYIIAAIIIMFFIGIKDDIIDLSAMKKLYGQITAAIVIVMFANIRITSLCGHYLDDISTMMTQLDDAAKVKSIIVGPFNRQKFLNAMESARVVLEFPHSHISEECIGKIKFNEQHT